ncbi:MAG TPA: MopE-related protein [Polyangiales bacterium]|nr:MopE-related protein [Polyangiales bacterium]
MAPVSAVAAAGKALALCALLLGGAAQLPGCSFDDGANPQRGCADCPVGQCQNGFCLVPKQTQSPATGNGGTSGSDGTVSTAGNNGGSGTSGSGTSGSGAGTSGAGGAGSGGSAGSAPSLPCQPGTDCYSPTMGQDVGECRAGQCDDGGTCIGEVGPGGEVCNQLDDDCDGELDEDLAPQSCVPSGSAGACAGGTMQCTAGTAACVAVEPRAEECNALDDDCNGTPDDGLDAACYPDGVGGCSPDGSGGFSCRGHCAAGVRHCVDGAFGACAEATGPGTETCRDDQAGDEDCDGKIDEGCACSGNETQACYSVPSRQRGVGVCKDGQQQCVNGVFAACAGEIVAAAESCANPGKDDNCDGRVDNITNLGGLCFGPLPGNCRLGTAGCRNGRLECITAAAQPETRCDGFDEDCDGRTDETFAFQTDEQNCGSCNVRCGANQTCCGGMCVNTASDPNHCKTCGARCGANSACCGGACVETNSMAHCGGCAGCGAGTTCCGRACVNANTVQACGPSCAVCGAGQQCCNGACTTPNTVAACGPTCAACGAGQQCCNGSCTTPNTVSACGPTCAVCGTGQSCCNGQCVNPTTPAACGPSCAACGMGEQCCNGSCVKPNTLDACGPGCAACKEGQECCGGSCVDTNSNDHCGGCKGCDTTAGLTCCNKTCVDIKVASCTDCNVPRCSTLCCGALCIDPMTDSANCNGCGLPCGQGCACVEGKCKTAEGNECL